MVNSRCTILSAGGKVVEAAVELATAGKFLAQRFFLQVSYKTLGFLPGRARQEGEIEPINNSTFQVTNVGSCSDLSTVWTAARGCDQRK